MVNQLPRRPRWLIALTAGLTLFQMGAAWRTVRLPDDLTVVLHLPLPLEFIANASWAILSGWVTLGLIRRRSRARRQAAYVLAGFVIYSAARLALFAQSDYDRGRLPFLGVSVGVILTMTFIYIRRAREKN
jgi:hypothetical protein